uniref:Nicastrin n=1 Tax=Clastoptera arizonana TaxID=38151 RepID=A0A1B6EBK1_9HEMI
MLNWIWISVSFSAIFILNIEAERKDILHMIYETFDNPAVCFRILNGTHQFGCSSTVSGDTGVVHFISSTEDLNWVFQKSNAGPYMAVVHPKMFIREVMLQLNESPKISGILLAVNGTSDLVDSYSPDDTCPNRNAGLLGSCNDAQPWNPDGSSLLFVDWKVPMFVVKDIEVIKKIYNCFTTYNLPLDDSQSERSLCSLQMRSHMHAAINTPTCMHRSELMVFSFNPQSYCDPMGDSNIVSTLFPRTDPSVQNRSMILVVTRLDSTSLFDGLAPGAMTTVSGIVTLLATSKVLKELISASKPTTFERNVMFIFLNGEAQDYIGSSRIVYDMKGMKFPASDLPLKFEDIEMIIDVNQLSASKEIHFYNRSTNSEIVKTFLKQLQLFSVKKNLVVTEELSTQFLPPSSVQPFLKEKPGLPAVVLSNHGKQFVNKFYNSFMDGSTNLQYVYANKSAIPADSVQYVLGSVSVALAQALYVLVTGTQPSEPAMNPVATTVDELLFCYLESADCEIFRNTTSTDLPPKPLNLYVGIFRITNTITRLTSMVLAQFTGTKVNETAYSCKEKSSKSTEIDYTWIESANGETQCIESTVRFYLAVSPAFEIEGYNWTSGEYSTWAESVWQELNLRMFLKPSFNQEIITLISGLAVLFISFVSVYWVNSRKEYLFSNQLCVRC